MTLFDILVLMPTLDAKTYRVADLVSYVSLWLHRKPQLAAETARLIRTGR